VVVDVVGTTGVQAQGLHEERPPVLRLVMPPLPVLSNVTLSFEWMAP
jgi:hypothetical protein